MKAHEYVVLEIARERERQMTEEGWTPEHDDDHRGGQIANAAASYARKSTQNYGDGVDHIPPGFWPWSAGWWKPKNPRRDLVRAAALIVAEIERLDRKAAADAGLETKLTAQKKGRPE